MQRNSRPSSARETGIGHGLKSLSRAWRIFASGFGYLFIGALSLGLALVVFPLIRLGPGDDRTKEFRAQYGIHLATRLYVWVIQILGICRIRCHGLERLREPGQLVVANHPTLLDAIVLMAHMPQTDCVVKERYFHDRYVGRTAHGAGYIPSTDGPSLVAECAKRIMDGRSLIIFPEGTRSPANGLGPLARGAAHVALRACRDPLPVTIDCQPATLFHGQKWWEVPDRRFTLTIRVGEPLVIKDIVNEDMSRARAARLLTASLRSHFERQQAVVGT
jgi:1-acyl-sn-glycerol-3-phosphate acyltransferase